jgi:hypothetical protein
MIVFGCSIPELRDRLKAFNSGKLQFRRGDAVAFGGEGEIRTHESREGPPVFKTGAFNRSATSPT